MYVVFSFIVSFYFLMNPLCCLPFASSITLNGISPVNILCRPQYHLLWRVIIFLGVLSLMIFFGVLSLLIFFDVLSLIIFFLSSLIFLINTYFSYQHLFFLSSLIIFFGVSSFIIFEVILKYSDITHHFLMCMIWCKHFIDFFLAHYLVLLFTILFWS